MNRKIIMAVAGISLFGSLSIAAASAPAATMLAPRADAAASATRVEKAGLVLPQVNTAIATNVAAGNVGNVQQTNFQQIGGRGNLAVSTVGANQGFGWPFRKVAMNDAPSARADILFDNE